MLPIFLHGIKEDLGQLHSLGSLTCILLASFLFCLAWRCSLLLLCGCFHHLTAAIYLPPLEEKKKPLYVGVLPSFHAIANQTFHCAPISKLLINDSLWDLSPWWIVLLSSWPLLHQMDVLLLCYVPLLWVLHHSKN